VEKIKTIGDAYMVAGGLPEPRPDHLEAVARLALAMRDEVAAIAERTGRDWLAVRIGIATGPVVAGVINRSRMARVRIGVGRCVANRSADDVVDSCAFPMVVGRTRQWVCGLRIRPLHVSLDVLSVRRTACAARVVLWISSSSSTLSVNAA
jgi:Adenylate and Guanylate cyclase catalytic domain